MYVKRKNLHGGEKKANMERRLGIDINRPIQNVLSVFPAERQILQKQFSFQSALFRIRSFCAARRGISGSVAYSLDNTWRGVGHELRWWRIDRSVTHCARMKTAFASSQSRSSGESTNTSSSGAFLSRRWARSAPDCRNP